MKKTLLVIAIVALSGCTDKFLAARISVNSGRAAISMADIGVDVADNSIKQSCTSNICLKIDPTHGQKYKECMNVDHTQEQAWKDCYSKFLSFKTKWPQIKKTADSAFNTAEAAINVAEQSKQELPPDIISLIKASACLVAESLEFLPDKYKNQIKLYLDMMKAFGCVKP